MATAIVLVFSGEAEMKCRESGMPTMTVWESFFDPECIVTRLGCGSHQGNTVEFGSGYGTFTIPAARRIEGNVFALEIEPELIAVIRHRVDEAGIRNVIPTLTDFVVKGSGLPDNSMTYAMLFNILHCADPRSLLRESKRVLAAGGLIGMIHWRNDIETPRGPPNQIRPTAAMCRHWAEEEGLKFVREEALQCCSWHWGLVMRKPFQ